jgi:hypothetical protein
MISFDKTTALYLQWSLDNAAEKAGLVAVQKGVNPRLLDLPSWRRETLDRIVEDALRLLFDAGCRAFRSNCASMRTFPGATSANLHKTGLPRSPKPAADFCSVEVRSGPESLTSHRPFANINAGCLPTSYQQNLERLRKAPGREDDGNGQV